VLQKIHFYDRLFIYIKTLKPCMKYDILIKNGIIFDGTAKDAFMSSLGIKNGKIIRIGNDILDKDAKHIY